MLNRLIHLRLLTLWNWSPTTNRFLELRRFQIRYWLVMMNPAKQQRGGNLGRKILRLRWSVVKVRPKEFPWLLPIYRYFSYGSFDWLYVYSIIHLHNNCTKPPRKRKGSRVPEQIAKAYLEVNNHWFIWKPKPPCQLTLRHLARLIR